MKQLVCEMCGSTDLIKQDGVFVCQACGTKYSVEEARKMMIEGTVDVSGSTIKVDTSGELANLYQIARRAKNENDSEQAGKYYEMILQKAPGDWEAAFYSVYYRSMNCHIAEIESASNTLANAIPSVIQLIMRNPDHPRLEEDASENMDRKLEVIRETTDRVLAISEMLYQGAKKAYSDTLEGNRNDPSFPESSFHKNSVISFLNRTSAVCSLLLVYGEAMEQLFIKYPNNTEFKDCTLIAWKKAPEMLYGLFCSVLKLNTNYAAMYNDMKKLPQGFIDLIKKYEPDYKNPFDNDPFGGTPPSMPSVGCYIATAVYGSYDCPEVWTLRRYRDYTLAETWYGRAFIHIYYSISPTLVKWFGHTEWFRKMWKGRLDHMVANLNANGVEDTPYEDRNW